MDKLDLTIRKIQNWFYENDFNWQSFNDYEFTTDLLINIFENSDVPTKVNLNKLSYFTQHELIPAPKKIGLKDTLGGSKGHYKKKVLMIIWYLFELKSRGISNQDDKRLLIYNYFSDEMPPRPVADTPIEERILYTYRLNKRFPQRLFRTENLTIPMYGDNNKVSSIHCMKIISLLNENHNLPYISVLIPTRNITHKEHEFLQALRKDKDFLNKEGVKIYHSESGKVLKNHMFDLEIFKRYPLKKRDDDKVTWLELLDENKTYESI